MQVDMFQISGYSPSDPIAKKPTEEQLEWSCRVAAAQEKLVRAYDLDALSYVALVCRSANASLRDVHWAQCVPVSESCGADEGEACDFVVAAIE